MMNSITIAGKLQYVEPDSAAVKTPSRKTSTVFCSAYPFLVPKAGSQFYKN
jgi:hypothetical protein